jgi:peroxiredoxin
MKLSDVPAGWYLVIILYRGYWCNACRDQLFRLKDDFSQFAPLHAVLATVSTDSVEDSYIVEQQWHFPFPLLSDPHLSLITALGAQHIKGHGIHDIAHPAIIIIDPQKTIRYKTMGQNPTDLPTDNELVYILQQMEKRFEK